MAGRLRDAGELLAPAVAGTIAALKLGDLDAAAVRLAESYALVIDRSDGHCRGCEDPECRRATTSAWTMRWLGPLLLDALSSLGATPAARSALKQDKPAAGPSRLQALRDARSG